MKDRKRDRRGRRSPLTFEEKRRSWEEVAEEFTRRTGLPMTPEAAAQCGCVAERKLRQRLADLPIVAEVLA